MKIPFQLTVFIPALWLLAGCDRESPASGTVNTAPRKQGATMGAPAVTPRKPPMGREEMRSLIDKIEKGLPGDETLKALSALSDGLSRATFDEGLELVRIFPDGSEYDLIRDDVLDSLAHYDSEELIRFCQKERRDLLLHAALSAAQNADEAVAWSIMLRFTKEKSDELRRPELEMAEEMGYRAPERTASYLQETAGNPGVLPEEVAVCKGLAIGLAKTPHYVSAALVESLLPDKEARGFYSHFASSLIHATKKERDPDKFSGRYTSFINALKKDESRKLFVKEYSRFAFEENTNGSMDSINAQPEGVAKDWLRWGAARWFIRAGDASAAKQWQESIQDSNIKSHPL